MWGAGGESRGGLVVRVVGCARGKCSVLQAAGLSSRLGAASAEVWVVDSSPGQGGYQAVPGCVSRRAASCQQ